MGRVSLTDILGIVVPLLCTTVGAVWYLSSRISVLNHRMDTFAKQYDMLDGGLTSARQARSQIWEKHNELTNRVTVIETKVNN